MSSPDMAIESIAIAVCSSILEIRDTFYRIRYFCSLRNVERTNDQSIFSPSILFKYTTSLVLITKLTRPVARLRETYILLFIVIINLVF